MKVYNAIPAQFKPPPGSTQLQYVEAFDSEFTLLLCERKPASLADMMNEVVEVEVNLTSARRKKVEEGEWRRGGARKREKEAKQPSTSNSQEARDNMLVKTLEKMMERLAVDGRPRHRE